MSNRGGVVAADEMRWIDDPQTLRALAHPLRLRILEVLSVDGPATATELAELLDESSGSTSYHLRQLAKYGYVEEAPADDARSKPWRRTSRGHSWPNTGDPAFEEAERGLRRQLFQRRTREILTYLDHEHELDAEWRDAAIFSDDLTWLTVEELEEVSRRIHAVLAEVRRDLDTRPSDDHGRVRFHLYGLPLTDSMLQEARRG